MTASKELIVTEKRRPPAAGKGRPKGAVNKSTRSVKEAIALAAETLGGAKRLAQWATEDPQNERMFWATIYPKLLPLQVAGDRENPVEMVTRVEIVALTAEGEKPLFK